MKSSGPIYSSPAHKTTNLLPGRSCRCTGKPPSSVGICSKTQPSSGKTNPSFLSSQPCSPLSDVLATGIRPSPTPPLGTGMAASPLPGQLFGNSGNQVPESLDMMHHLDLPLRQPTPEINPSTQNIWTPNLQECE